MKITITIDDNELKEFLNDVLKGFQRMPETESHNEVVVTNDLKEKAHTTKITELPLSRRAKNALRWNGDLETLADLLACTDQYILRIRNFGKHSYNEVIRFLNTNDLQLGMLPPVWKEDFYSSTTARLTDNSEYRQFDTWQERDAFIKKMNGK